MMKLSHLARSTLASFRRKLESEETKRKRAAVEVQRSKLDIRFNQMSNSLPQKSPQILDIVPTKNNTKMIGANWLINFKDNQYSEHGEDGIIRKIFEILQPENKWVCEFGAHDPEVISNTWRLINEKNWNALLIEADSHYYNKLKNYYKNKTSVHCLHAKVSYEGHEQLDSLLKNTQVPLDLDFMIIDIDGNDYHVWEAINTYCAKVVMIEFNASIPTNISFIQPRNLNVNQGSSLKALVDLAATKGYKLIAVTSWNAFFIQEKYYDLFFKKEVALEEMYVFPAKHPIWMRAFQFYDGTITILPWNEMLWHKVDLKINDYQVLPESLRSFSPVLAKKNYFYEKTGEKKGVENENDFLLNRIYQMPKNKLSQYAKNNYSRYGEDGIIDYLTKKIAGRNQYFVDVGAFDGITFSKSRALVCSEDWEGLLIESENSVRETLEKNTQSFQKIKVSKDSINNNKSLSAILKQYHAPQDIDLLILNVYGMEFYLWDSLKKYSPKIIAVQFNPTISNDVKFIQKSDFTLHQGCSLRALVELATLKNYQLACVTLETAFFIHKQYLNLFPELSMDSDIDLDDMFAPAEMHLFQLYDGTIVLKGLDRLFWHAMRIDDEMLQVVPKPIRKFHQFADADSKPFFYRV